MIRTEFGIVPLPLRVPCSRRRNGCQSTHADVFFAKRMHKNRKMVPIHVFFVERRHNTYIIRHCTAAAACAILSAS